MPDRPLPELVNVARQADALHAAIATVNARRADLDEAIALAVRPPGRATVTDVARAAELSRESVYAALERVRLRQEDRAAG